MLGTFLYALPIVSVLLERGAPWWLWLALALNVGAWPHIAWQLARRAHDPIAVEHRNLIADGLASGVWIAATAVSLLPTAALITVLMADRYAVGGWRLSLGALAALVLSFLPAWAATGWAFQPETSLQTMLACLPLMFGYQVVLSLLGSRLTRTIARQNRALDRLNRTDALSDLPNRRHFDARATDAFHLAQRGAICPALLLIDIDHFKAINDRYGHGAGDTVLRSVADALRNAARATDVPARLGGDEFALLLGHTDPDHAGSVAERIRLAVAALRFYTEPGLSCTVSVGLSDIRATHATPAQWARDADAALYRSKTGGRNRVSIA